jgi:hypothetical protein
MSSDLFSPLTNEGATLALTRPKTAIYRYSQKRDSFFFFLPNQTGKMLQGSKKTKRSELPDNKPKRKYSVKN